MDSFRHGEYFDSRTVTVKEMTWKVAIDLTIGLGIIFIIIFFTKPSSDTIGNILIGAFFSMLPDLLTVFNWAFPKNKTLAAIKKFHSFCHHYGKFPKFSPERQWTFRNTANDIFFSILAIFLLIL
jgi:hypothetical protein